MSGPSVPAEFIGQARAFRARIGAGDPAVGLAIQRIAKPLEARRRRKATFRPETLIDAERAFRCEVPSGSRLMGSFGALLRQYCAGGDLPAGGGITQSGWWLACQSLSSGSARCIQSLLRPADGTESGRGVDGALVHETVGIDCRLLRVG